MPGYSSSLALGWWDHRAVRPYLADAVATSPWTAKLFDGLDLDALAKQLGTATPFCSADTTTTFGRSDHHNWACVGRSLPIRRSTTFFLPPTWQSLTIPPFGSTGSSRASQYCFSCQISWTI